MEKIIRILPEAEDFLNELPYVLTNAGYKSSFEAAIELVDDIIHFIRNLNKVPHYTIPPEFQYHFNRYGNHLQYAFFRRPSSCRTTWYVFFMTTDTQILVTHISNNWVEGQYLR